MAKTFATESKPKTLEDLYPGLRTKGFVSIAEAQYFISWAEKQPQDEKIVAAIANAKDELAVLNS